MLVTLASVLVVLVLICTSAWAQGTATQTVLMIQWGAEDFPGSLAVDEAVRSTLSNNGPPVNYYTEYLESETFPAESATLALRDYIRRKFSGRHIDLVIANSTPATQFALGFHADLFPDAPVLFVAGTVPDEVRQRKMTGVTGLVSDVTFGETLDTALALQPSVKRVFVVAREPSSNTYEQRVRTALQRFSSRVELTYIREPSLDGLLAAVRSIPPEAVILYTRYTPDNAGRIVYSDEVARLMVQAAAAPIYSPADIYMGTGVVGGVMRPRRAVGTQLGQMARKILQGTSVEAIPIERVESVPIFDWRQLQRWGIDQSRLPANAEIRFRTPTAWESYRWYIVGTIAVVTAQLVLIVALITQRARRHRAEETVRKRDATLRTTYERSRKLAGRLINAQEAARAGIAQDLHDDICQRLVYVSLTLNNLKGASGDIQDQQTQKVLVDLENDTQAVFDGIRRLSHDLHPTTLRVLGFVPALRAHCGEIEKRYDVQVAFTSEGDYGDVHPDVAVSLFRIAQESLRNAIAHGEAKLCTVTVARLGDHLELTVGDDGRGFDLTAARREGGGLGLVTMEERAATIDAHIKIVADPGRGTTVYVRAPIQGASSKAEGRRRPAS